MEAHASSVVTNQLNLIKLFVQQKAKVGQTAIGEEDASYVGPLESGSIPAGKNFRVTLKQFENRRQMGATQLRPTPKSHPSPHGLFNTPGNDRKMPP